MIGEYLVGFWPLATITQTPNMDAKWSDQCKGASTWSSAINPIEPPWTNQAKGFGLWIERRKENAISKPCRTGIPSRRL